MKVKILIFLSLCLMAVSSACRPIADTDPVDAEASLSTEESSLGLENFTAELKSKGTHGAMVCYQYHGDPSDLDGLTLSARLIRNEEIIERMIPPEVVDGEDCFEVTDAKYVSISPNQEGGRFIIPDQPLSIRIDAKSVATREISSQTISLGKYSQFPFLSWIFPDDSKPGCLAGGHQRDGMSYPAWDLVPVPSANFQTIVGTPVLAPVNGFFYLTSFSQSDNPHEKINTVMIYSPDTGFVIDLTHVYDLVLLDGKWELLEGFINQEIVAGQQIGVISPRDYVSTLPHIHLQILIPPKPINTNKPLTPGQMNDIYGYLIDNSVPNVDFIAEKLFLDKQLNNSLAKLSASRDACDHFEWGDIEFPQQLPITIDGYANDWSGYQASLSDIQQDDTASGVMNLSNFYVTTDENYLYMMVEAGRKPDEANPDWSFYFHLDLFVKNACGSSDRIIKLWAENPYAFKLSSLDKCDYTLSTQYPVMYSWEEVLEIKINLAYLKNPPQVSALDVTGYYIDPIDQHINQDVLP